MKIAIIGNIGSGKSTAAAILARLLSCSVLSLDDINAELLETPEYLAELRQVFTEAFPLGKFEKKALASVIYCDPAKKRALEELAHPRILRLLEERLREAQGDVIVEIPLMNAVSLHFDQVIMIVSALEVRSARISHRDGCDGQTAQAKIAAAPGDAELLPYATIVVENSSTEEDLEARLTDVARTLKGEKN